MRAEVTGSGVDVVKNTLVIDTIGDDELAARGLLRARSGDAIGRN